MTPDGTTVVRLKQGPAASRTLVCLGFCGGGTGAFHTWLPALPADVDLVAVCYPGREGRFAEPYASSWTELAEDTAEAVRSIAAEGPYVLFGHSMGGWMAFDVADRLAPDAPAPSALVVSACNAPDRGLLDRDRFPAQREDDGQLLEWMRTHGLLPAHVLADPDLTDMAVELMRADIRARDTFEFRTGTTVDSPLHLLSGAADSVVAEDAAARWAKLTSGAFRHDLLPGGHFYTPEVWRNLPARLTALTAPLPARW
ncbi:alpha/beta fold hydrolase [Streptomyces violaceusniger]|uniref:thioesterase II family protein n=1 Tax=Streptomyces violaceusniger TaxID=68280 RepID=UPI00343FCFE0